MSDPIGAIEMGRKVVVEMATSRLREMYGGAVSVNTFDQGRCIALNLDADAADELAARLSGAAAASRDAYYRAS